MSIFFGGSKGGYGTVMARAWERDPKQRMVRKTAAWLDQEF